MTIRLTLIFLAVAFTLLPLVLPARQLAVGESADVAVTAPADHAISEAAAVLEMVKNLDKK